MAEGSDYQSIKDGSDADYQSIKDGSDADFDMACTPCGEDNLREEAIKYCSECEEYLCVNCTRHHGRQKATKSHVLQDKNAAKQSLVVARIKCHNHPDRDIEMYCKTHDMVYCTMCIATDHRACEGINKLETEANSRMNQQEIQQLIKETTIAQVILQALELKENDNLTSIQKQRNSIQEKLDGTEEKLLKHIRKLKITTEKSLTRKCTTLKERINSNISHSSCITQMLKKNEEQLKSIGSLDAEQQFAYTKLMWKSITDAYKLRKNIESDGMKSLVLTRATEMERVVLAEETLGHVIIDNARGKVPKQFKIKSKSEVNVKFDNDRSTCLIVDICLLNDGQILLADSRNRKIKQLDINCSLTNYCDIDTSPLGICCISKNEVAVKLAQKKVQFITIGIASLTKTKLISIESGDFYGMTFFDDGLWVSTPNGISIHRLNGTIMKRIKNDQIPVSKGYVAQHMAVSDYTVIVANWSNGVVCLNKDGTILRELRDKRLKATRGVCVANDGTVFVCGYMSNNVVMFSKDGRCLGELVGANSGMKYPIDVCYNQTNNNIIVACGDSNKIYVFELS